MWWGLMPLRSVAMIAETYPLDFCQRELDEPFRNLTKNEP
jgi:hypothetical protein